MATIGHGWPRRFQPLFTLPRKQNGISAFFSIEFHKPKLHFILRLSVQMSILFHSLNNAMGQQMLCRILQIVSVVTLSSCQLPQKQVPAPSTEQKAVATLITDAADYPKYVGKKIEVVGVVSNSKCPYVAGIQAWDLNAYRGGKVRMRGVLRATVVTKEDIEEANRIPIAHQGAGTFYDLEKMEFEVMP